MQGHLMKSMLFGSLMGLFEVSSVLSQTASPADFLGREPGTAFTPHHRLVDYCEHVASHSSFAKLISYGVTPEGRPLQVLVFSSPDNLNQLEALRLRHLDAQSNEDLGVVWLSYDVHGNEAVCTESAIEVIGKLAMGEGESAAWLEDMVVLVDPCLNPDGHERYVQFFQREASATPNSDASSIEHDEPWPGGRLNHYLFDLNRDWAWLTQDESQMRWDLYRQWMPHVHGDYHEMGYNSPYYFPPAVEPYHEVISDWQRAFQWEIGQATASNFDARGETYYTDEDFDLFYPSYGDTYPMYHGAIGMTYEQGGSGGAGLAVEREDGSTLTLAQRIENHVESSWVLLETAFRLREQLVSEFRDWQRMNLAGEDLDYSGYLIPKQNQSDLIQELIGFLQTHELDVKRVSNPQNRAIVGRNYATGRNEAVMPETGDLWIPAQGRHARFLSVLMDPNPILSDSLTYDITAWALPYAYGLEAFACSDAPMNLSSWPVEKPPHSPIAGEAYGWMFPVQGIAMGKLLAKAFNLGLSPRVCDMDLSWGPDLNAPKGTPMFIAADHAELEDWLDRLNQLSEFTGIAATEMPGGMTSAGPDLGSSQIQKLRAPRIACATGSPVSATAMGSVWWHIEQNLEYPLTRLSFTDLTVEQLEPFDVFILPSGWYGAESGPLEAIQQYAAEGGWVVAISGAFSSMLTTLNRSDAISPESPDDAFVSYEDQRRNRASGRIEGAVFLTQNDPSNPLLWATPGPVYSLQNSSRRQSADLSGGQQAVWIPAGTEQNAGFAGARLTPVPEDIWVAGSMRISQGGLAGFADDPLFRGFWTSGQTLFNQAIFVAPAFMK